MRRFFYANLDVVAHAWFSPERDIPRSHLPTFQVRGAEEFIFPDNFAGQLCPCGDDGVSFEADENSDNEIVTRADFDREIERGETVPYATPFPAEASFVHFVGPGTDQIEYIHYREAERRIKAFRDEQRTLGDKHFRANDLEAARERYLHCVDQWSPIDDWARLRLSITDADPLTRVFAVNLKPSDLAAIAARLEPLKAEILAPKN